MSVMEAEIRLSRYQSGVGLIELLACMLIFSFWMVGLTKMQMKAGMESIDNHQRSTALHVGKSLIDRIAVNNSDDALQEYRDRISEINSCEAYTLKNCEATSTTAVADSCSAVELAAFDVWNVFCSDNEGLNSQLIDYTAQLSCQSSCASNANMTLRLTWVSKIADSDERLVATKKQGDGSIASNVDSISLDFRP